MPRGLIILALCLALAAPVMPAMAAPSPAPCAAMAAMPMGHAGMPGPSGCCRARQSGRCCLEEAPCDSRPLALGSSHRTPVPLPVLGPVEAPALPLCSRPAPEPRPRARAPVPLYLTNASLLI
ncbi:MAG: hypothetical protein K9K66_14945 [Desulfarculaceae bacterium]|nr:hypothetical protein [Desulfarculaceae bacterium]MCF8072490.1 hypothetical protein [Desulfarculaceae bacterium]MCF8102951.1 hypothetical protein [Desulfarculaceae bacterium]MCF8117031.1 hypothetical protein [Desulfarculaceae bacterium]